jgi:hypothetical protein
MKRPNAGTGMLAVAVGLIVGSHGCMEATDATHLGVTYDTIAGVEHVITSGPGAWAEGGDAWSVDRSGGVIIGELEGEDVYVFGRISGVTVDSRGQIHVADSQALEIRVFSREGEFLRRVGRDGEGPGEFRHIGGLALAPDGVAALDGILGRVTVFGSTGEVIQTFRLRRPYMLLKPFAAMGFGPQGQFLDRARLSMTTGVDSLGVTASGADGTEFYSALLGVIQEDQVWIERNGMLFRSFPRPLAPQVSFSFGPGGLAYLSRGDEYRIDVFSPTGDSLRTIRRPVEPRPVTTEQRDSALAVVFETFERAGENPGREVELPDRNPVIMGLMPDFQGNLWVLNHGEAEGGQSEWSVHDPAGRYLGPILLPAMTVTQIGADFVAGTTRDELGVARAAVFPISRRER